MLIYRKGGFLLNNHQKDFQFEKEQYFNQSNLVYINTLIFCGILSLIFFFLVGSTLAAIFNLGGMGVAAIAILLNQRDRYGTGAFLYISFISLISLGEVLLFGLDAGFHYFIFNMAGLIIFTNWKPWLKLLGVVLEALLLSLMFIAAYGKEPVFTLNVGMILFFHGINVMLNIAGIANSAYYYRNIASRAHHRVRDLASMDYLTSLMNRTSFDAYASTTFRERRKPGQNLGILLLDIDHFKRVNDTWGHLCGDELLRQFGGLLSQNIRAGDFAARYGGEEFVIITLVENAEKLWDFAERLRIATENMVFSCDTGEHRITVSIGALFVPSDEEISHIRAIEMADRLLYRAKEEGRNRVIIEETAGRN